MRATTLHNTEAHSEGVWALAWAPDGASLLTGSVDETCKQWTLSEDGPKTQHTFTGQTLGVISLDIDPSGTYAASSSLDSVIRVWSLEDCNTKCLIETQPSETWRIAFGPPAGDSVILAAAGGSTGNVIIHRGGDQDPVVVSTMQMPAVSGQALQPGPPPARALSMHARPAAPHGARCSRPHPPPPACAGRGRGRQHARGLRAGRGVQPGFQQDSSLRHGRQRGHL